MAKTNVFRPLSPVAMRYPGLHFFPGKWMYALIFLGIGADALWISLSPHGILPDRLGFLVFAVVLCLALALFWRWLALTPRVRQSAASRKRREIVSLFLQGAAFMILAANALALLHYLTLTLEIPYADGLLQGWDRALGLDWMGYFRFFAEDPLWLALSFHVHGLLGPVCLFGFIALLLLQEVERARLFLVALTLTAVLCICAGMFFPVRAAIAHVVLAEAPGLLARFGEWPGLGRWPGHYRIDILADLRSGAPMRIGTGTLKEMITFPSLHAAAGAVFACSCRGMFLFWPAAVFAVANLLAAPVWSGHYFVDVIAGAIVALGVCLGAEHLLRRGGNLASGEGQACNPGK